MNTILYPLSSHAISKTVKIPATSDGATNLTSSKVAPTPLITTRSLGSVIRIEFPVRFVHTVEGVVVSFSLWWRRNSVYWRSLGRHRVDWRCIHVRFSLSNVTLASCFFETERVCDSSTSKSGTERSKAHTMSTSAIREGTILHESLSTQIGKGSQQAHLQTTATLSISPSTSLFPL